MTIRGLALHAQRIGRVSAHPGAWAKVIREKGWGRPQLRLHPPKPKTGFRAIAPNEAQHVAVTNIKLLDDTKTILERDVLVTCEQSTTCRTEELRFG